MPDPKPTEPRSAAIKKLLLSGLDRTFFIATGVIGTVATSYITGVLKINPPELVVDQSYSRIDVATPVATNVGGLKLDYKAEAALPYGILRLDISNEGRGAAETVRFQVKVPKDLNISYQEDPDFKVYSPSTLTLDANEFYAVLDHFPSGAHDYLALKVAGDSKLLNDARIKLVNDDYEGEVKTTKY